MGKYQDIYDDSVENESSKQVGTKTYKFKEVGERVIGMLLNVEQVKNKRFKHAVNKYTFETDEGVLSVILGQAADKIYGPALKPGDVYGITYDGDQKLSRGNTMHQYTILLLQTAAQVNK